MGVDEWEAQIGREREEKDQFLAGHWQSPIPSQDRARLEGLDYYPPDPDCRFELQIHEHGKRESSGELTQKAMNRTLPDGASSPL